MRHIDVEIAHKEVPAEVQEGDLPPAMLVNLDLGARPGLPGPFGEEDLKLQTVYQLSIVSQMGTFSDRPEGQRLVRPRVMKGLGRGLQKHGHIDGEPFDLEGEVFCGSGQHFSRAGTQVIEHMDSMGVQTISPSNSLKNQTVTYSSDLPIPSAYTPDCATPPFLPWITQPSAGVTRARTSGVEHHEGRSQGSSEELQISSTVEHTGRTLANPGASSPTNSELNIESRGGLLLLESGRPPQWGFRAVSSDGLASPEKTLGGPRTVSLGSSTLLSGSSACSAKKRLRPSGNMAESCSEDQGPSTSKQSCLTLPSPGLCRGAHCDTEAGAVPFWKHRLPSSGEQPKNASDVRRVDRRQKSGLRLKPCRLRRGGRKDARRSCRPPAAAAVSHSLLGNFEESILKGRFSPSGRIEGFTAEIGASGSYCPPHATLPVQVTCYDVSEHRTPPPFLGVINLESLGKKGYSTPKVGTIQVTLFNPNKAVVKMFLVRYNFGDMPVNHMTFLRHRIFLVAENEGEGQREGPEVRGMDRKKILCYLIHLSFQSSKSGKIYLHNNIRLLLSRKSSEVDTGIPYQLRSFTEVPKNPKYSPQV